MWRRWLLALSPLALVGQAGAQTSYPMITHVTPVVLHRGQTATVTVSGRMDFAGARQVLFSGEGVEAEVLPGPAKGAVTQVKVKVKVAGDALPGVREFRVIASAGVSSVGQLVVGEDPVVAEAGDNDTREKAQPITLSCAVSGLLERAEDVDFFKFTARAGQTATFEVLGARLQDKIHDLQKHADPMLTLYDAEGRELAANDDAVFADPLLAYTFESDGDYYLQVRESRYDGDPRWVYALLATDRPHVTHVYPMAGNPGQELTVEPVGSAAKWAPKTQLRAPDTPGLHRVTLDVGGARTNPVAFLVSELPQVLEAEANDEPARATTITLPCGINGRVGQARDLDHFRFAGRKGQALRFEVKARRFGTPLVSEVDSVLDVLDARGRVLASNDDADGKDAILTFTPPADGDYVLRLRDLNSQGGPGAVYHVEAGPALPDFSLRCDGDKAGLAPGTRTAWFVHVTRENGFTGPVTVEVKGLPAGVSVNPLTIPPTMTQGVLVLSAWADAPKGAANVEVVGRAAVTREGKEEELTRRAAVEQEIYVPGGGRALFGVNLQTVAVAEKADLLDVQVSPARVDLKPGQEVKLEVKVRRAPGYDKAVSLDVVLQHLSRVYGDPLPPGVSVVAGKSKTRLGTGDTGHIVLRAAPDAAPVEGVPVCVLAHVSINFVVKVGYASAPIPLTVHKK